MSKSIGNRGVRLESTNIFLQCTNPVCTKVITSQRKEAAEFVKTLVNSGDPVGIEFDRQGRDKSVGLLAYVYLSNGKILNEEILKRVTLTS